MGLLTLPRLHSDIPRSIQTANADSDFLGFFEEHVRKGNFIPPAKSGRSLEQALASMLHKRSKSSAHEIKLITGQIAVGRLHVNENGNLARANNDDESGSFGLARFPTTSREYLNIGPVIKRLEAAQVGLGQTMLAVLDEAAPLVGWQFKTPSDLVEEFSRYRWEDALSIGQMAKRTMEEIDAKAMEVVAENYGEDYEAVKPSELLEALGGGLHYSVWLFPKRRVEITFDGLRAAGFDEAGAKRLVQLVNRDLAKSIKKFDDLHRNSDQTQHGFNYSSFQIGLTEVDDFSSDAAQFLDECFESAMQEGDEEITFAVTASPLVDGYYRPSKKSNQTVDSIDVMAAYLNHVRHTDELLVALCG